MKKRSKVSLLTATLITFGSLAGGANGAVTCFSDFKDCINICRETYILNPPEIDEWGYAACAADCSATLIKCVKDNGLLPSWIYSPNPVPRDLIPEEGLHTTGSTISINFQSLRVEGTVGDPSSVVDAETYASFLDDNSVATPIGATVSSVVAMRYSDFEDIASTLDQQSGNGGFTHSSWSSDGVNILSGSVGSYALNTNGLTDGTYVLLTTFNDPQNGNQYGLSHLTLVPEPSVCGLMIAGTVMLVGHRRRRS